MVEEYLIDLVVLTLFATQTFIGTDLIYIYPIHLFNPISLQSLLFIPYLTLTFPAFLFIIHYPFYYFFKEYHTFSLKTCDILRCMVFINRRKF